MIRSGRAALLALLALALFAFAFHAPALAAAQAAAPVIESAELRLWPEYDDPGLLVIFSGSFPSDASFPMTVSIPVAAGARNIQATYQDSSGSLINRAFEVENGRLTYEIPSGTFHMEYYVDRAPSGDERQIDFAFEAPYAINNLRVAVQQPARSSGFSLSPAAEDTEQDGAGLTYHIFNRRNIAAGEKLDMAVNYAKSDTGLSAPQLAVTSTGVAPSSGAAVAPAATAASTDWLPWVLIGAGVALFAGLLGYWLISRRRAEPVEAAASPAARPARPTQSAVRPPAQGQRPLPTVPARPAETPTSAAGPAAFCHNCGNALKAEDRFCSQCGTSRR